MNKVSSAVQLRFDVRNSPSLPENVRGRLEKIAGKRITGEGVLVIRAARYRAQERNRLDALDRLAELVRRAACKDKLRVGTRPTFSSQVKRLDSKARRSRTKRLRAEKAELD